MRIDLTDTTASKIAAALVRARRVAGSPAMDMVLTLVIATDEANHYDAVKAASTVSAEHPARIVTVVRRPNRGAQLDAEVAIGQQTPGEQVLLRVGGPVADHAASVVLPLLLPDSPVVTWWPAGAPDDPAADPLGALANRRLTDAETASGSRIRMLETLAGAYAPGDTDLSWTRLTPWRTYLAAALDQVDVRVTGGEVAAQQGNPSAALLVSWLSQRLGVPIATRTTRTDGLAGVRLETPAGDIAVLLDEGRATFRIPGQPDRPLALDPRPVAELLAEDLRRLDEDQVYAASLAGLIGAPAQEETA